MSNPDSNRAAEPEPAASGSRRSSPGGRLGPYEIVESLGAGGMGEVYRARDPRLERDVALKVLPREVAGDPERLHRFQREAKTLAALDHPSIVTVHSVEEADGVHFLTMELVDGKTLAEVIPSGGLTLERFLEIAIPLADAVAAAHARGVVHRDLKPANVMVGDDGRGSSDRVKILDFGLARPGQGEDDDLASLPTETLEQLTREGQIVGTVPYMAPEQLQGEPATARSDIFSLGAVLYEMATGRRPFAGESGADLVSAILRDRPTPVSEVRSELPRQLGRIVARCLAKQPRRRFQTALDVHNELDQLREEVVSERSVAVHSEPGRRPRPLWLLGSLAVAGMALLGLVLWPTSPAGEPSPPGAGDEDGAVRSLVVLPATVHGPDGDAYLADAIPGTLSTGLTGIDGLETKAPPRAAELEGRELGPERIAELYGVDVLVQPAVTVEGDLFLLTLQLVEAADRSLLWSEQYRGSRDGYIDLVERAAAELQRQLRPGRPVGDSVAGLTASSEAELAFRRGQYHSNQFNMVRRPEDLEAARHAFRQALDLDPEMAEAAAEMGFLYLLRVEEGRSELLDEAKRWADRALEIDPTTSLAWVDLSLAAVYRAQLTLSLGHALRAVGADATAARGHGALAWNLGRVGLPELCRRAAKESIRLDPLYLPVRTTRAWCLAMSGESSRGLAAVEEALEIEPDEVFARLMRIALLLATGRLDEARVALDEPAISDFGRVVRKALSARLALLAGTKTPEATGEELLQILREAPHPMVRAWVAGALPDLARRDAGPILITLLEEIERQEGSPHPYPFLWSLSEPTSLADRPELQAMLDRSRARVEEILGILVEAQRQETLPAYLDEPLAEALREHEASALAEEVWAAPVRTEAGS